MNIGAAAPAAAKAPEKPKEEEVDALDGGMDMFGGVSIECTCSIEFLNKFSCRVEVEAIIKCLIYQV